MQSEASGIKGGRSIRKLWRGNKPSISKRESLAVLCCGYCKVTAPWEGGTHELSERGKGMHSSMGRGGDDLLEDQGATKA